MSIDRSSFQSLYDGQPRWEIGRPQKALLAVADQITGSILDSGCGTGENALYFANRGHNESRLTRNTTVSYNVECSTPNVEKNTRSCVQNRGVR